MVNVPPSRSSARSFASRARPTRSARTPAISVSESSSALRITGTTSPCGAATARPTFALGWRRIASSVNSAFTSRCRMSACAQTLVRMSVTVMRTSGSRSRSVATRAFTRVMSAEAWSWKTGICQASVSRRAIVLRTFESGTRSTSPAGTGAGAAAGAAWPPASGRSMSSATIRPSGPVPRMPESSMPRSRAMRRASGEALIRPLPEATVAGGGARHPTFILNLAVDRSLVPGT